MSWPAVPLRSTLGDWAGRTIAAGGPGDLGRPTTALLQIGKPTRSGHVRVVHTDMAHEKLDPPSDVTLPADLTVSEAVLALAHVRPDRAAVPPKVKGMRSQNPTAGRRWLGAAVAAIVVLAVVLGQPMLLLSALLPGIVLLVSRSFHSAAVTAGMKPRVFDGATEVLASGVHGRLPVDHTEVDAAGLSPRSRVDLVKERLGGLRTDIVYRIENSALFDAAVPQTERLELALLSWDEGSPEATQLATEVERAFDEARRHAEDLGLDHLPTTARDSGRRAA
ncbi:hypothetical protein ACFQ06_05960, partial [Tessaracoccus lubricantis]